MSKSANPLKIRQSDDGKCDIEMRGGNWVRCETEEDATVLSNAPVLEALWLKNRPLDKAMAAKLENTAKKMDQYNMHTDARRFRNWANLARGKGS